MRFRALRRLALPGCRLAAFALLAGAGFLVPRLPAAENVFLTEVPDYDWFMGCFGTATGNLIGYWDRHGMEDFYTGPTARGVAPLTSFGSNIGIRSLWATRAGLDGRPTDQPGHADDYYVDYESTVDDPYVIFRRPEHVPDCIGDFLGLNQNKWANLGGECAGNIDAYSFNYFDRGGARRTNYTPSDELGNLVPDIQSGLRAWTQYRGYDADTFSQLADFNPDHPPGQGFTFADLKAEIDSGYPVLLFMQAYGTFSRTLHGRPGINPIIHGMLAYGYVIDDEGVGYVRYRTSWASGNSQFSPWNSDNWTPNGELNLPLRGVIGYHPRPRLTSITRAGDQLRLAWQGPLSVLRDEVNSAETVLHRYRVERARELKGGETTWESISEPVSAFETTVTDCCAGTAFYRLRLLLPAEAN